MSAVAEAVVCKTGSQHDLIERFPPDEFRHAEPNEGYLIMAALLREGALADVLTLNFDSAARTALGRLGVGSRVSTVRRPEDYIHLGTHNLIYLHRDIDSDEDSLILRAKDLEKAWKERWEQVIAQRVLSGPVTVFVGIGSPASVLIDTTRRILAAIDKQANVYVVDPIAHGDSVVATELNTPSKDYVCIGWGDFMEALAQRLVEEHRASIQHECDELTKQLGQKNEDVTELCRRLAELGILRLGKLRAAWLAEGSSYLPQESGTPLRLFGSLVLGVRAVERISGHQATFGEEGVVEFSQDTHITRVIVCSGGGWMTDARMETELKKRQQALRHRGITSAVALVGGVDSSASIAAPSDIVADTDPYDLVTGSDHLRTFSLAELRANPELAYEVVR
ncbi:MAG: hypothetical protein F4X57_11655 [Chloroflexi bacterium]|nr:hypothetical protein [Chloroflexota bacterium]